VCGLTSPFPAGKRPYPRGNALRLGGVHCSIFPLLLLRRGCYHGCASQLLRILLGRLCFVGAPCYPLTARSAALCLAIFAARVPSTRQRQGSGEHIQRGTSGSDTSAVSEVRRSTRNSSISESFQKCPCGLFNPSVRRFYRESIKTRHRCLYGAYRHMR
jgi:hypothetical protein